MVVVPLPAPAEVGVNPVMFGTGFEMVRGTRLELPPPGGIFGFEFCGGFTTEICSTPETASSAAGTVACSVAAFTKMVGILLPFTVTFESDTKFVPMISIANCPAPVRTPCGDIEVIFGTGFVTGATVNCSGFFGDPPPG